MCPFRAGKTSYDLSSQSDSFVMDRVKYFATKGSRIVFEVSEIIREGLIGILTAIVVWASSVKGYHKVTLSSPVF